MQPGQASQKWTPAQSKSRCRHDAEACSLRTCICQSFVISVRVWAADARAPHGCCARGASSSALGVPAAACRLARSSARLLGDVSVATALQLTQLRDKAASDAEVQVRARQAAHSSCSDIPTAAQSSLSLLALYGATSLCWGHVQRAAHCDAMGQVGRDSCS